MIGELNPLPFQVGGSPSRLEADVDAVKKMVGSNGYNEDDESIEGEWRRSRQFGLTALGTFDERATMQYFPQSATDHIGLWENLLGLLSDTSSTDEQRRQVIVPDYTSSPEAWWEALVLGLESIDSRASVLVRAWDNAGNTINGRAFEQFSPLAGQEYDTAQMAGGERRTGSQWPNWSDMHHVNVLFELGNGIEPSREQQIIASEMQDFLNEVLPGWVTFSIIYTDSGFILDQSRLDATGFGT